MNPGLVVRISFLIRLLSLGFVLPLAMSTMVYVGFVTNYTQGVFSESGFAKQYGSGVYKYRVLGVRLLTEANNLFESMRVQGYAPKALKIMDQEASATFYTTYYAVNTVLLCAACTVLFFVYGNSGGGAEFAKDLTLMFQCAFMALTEFVVTPYDILSYLFLALAALLILRRRSFSAVNVMLLACVVGLAAATRESAVLILSFYFAVHWGKILERPRGRLNSPQVTLTVLLLVFVGTYVSLRLVLGFEHGLYQELELTRNLRPLQLLGSATFAALAGVCLAAGQNRTLVGVFLIAASPYIVAMEIVASTWELRLWAPVITLMLILMQIPPELNADCHREGA